MMPTYDRSDVSLEHTVKNSTPADQTRWEAIVQRNREADGAFVYGVLTTGVYCSPSCSSRLPNRENVRFFDSSEEAGQAGFRPCKRCSPNAPKRHRFYHETTTTLGMESTDYNHGAQCMYIRYAIVQSYLGWVLVAATAQGICTVDFGDSPEVLKGGLYVKFPKAELQDNAPGFEVLVAKVLTFLESPRLGFDLPLDIQGTAFQRRVWKALQGIPAGATASYTDIAARIGQPKAVRAVAQACAANAIAVVIPCHRVKRGNGELGGYRWGVERKRALLQRESDQR